MFARVDAARLAIVLLCAAVLGAGCARRDRADAELAKLTDEFIEYRFKIRPTEATWSGEHRYDGEIGDYGAQAIAEAAEAYRGYLDRLERIDRKGLSPANRTDADYLSDVIELSIFELEELRPFERNPTFYTELLWGGVYSLLSRESAPLERRLEFAASRLEEFPRIIDQARANLKDPPKLLTESAIKSTQGVVSFLKKDLVREAGRAPGKKERVEHALGPALEALYSYQEYLEKDLINRSFGDVRLGERLYRRLFDLTIGPHMTPEEVVAAAYDQVRRSHDRMLALAVPLYEEATGKKVSAEPDADERRAIILWALDLIADDHTKPFELLDACKAAYAEAEAFVREKDLVAIPPDPVRIIWAPEIIRMTQVAASIPPGRFDRDKTYFFVVSAVSPDLDPKSVEAYLREYNNEMIRVITIHEAMPGHNLQFVYGNRNPSVIRGIFPNPSSFEGWAVYCQNMMAEEGFHGGDPRFRIAVEHFNLRAAISAIIDSGMHRENMQEKEAIRIIADLGFQSEREALSRWRRRTGLYPVYLVTYFAGCREVMALRDEARERLGARFDLKQFHEKLLHEGPIPMRYVRRAVLEAD